MRGQAGLELLAVAVVVLLMFFVSYAGVMKRGQDISAFERDAGIQKTLDYLSSVISTAAVSEGARFNLTLPSVYDGCTPRYTVYESVVIADCGGTSYSARYLATGLINGTSNPPFVISDSIVVENRRGIVVITP